MTRYFILTIALLLCCLIISPAAGSAVDTAGNESVQPSYMLTFQVIPPAPLVVGESHLFPVLVKNTDTGETVDGAVIHYTSDDPSILSFEEEDRPVAVTHAAGTVMISAELADVPDVVVRQIVEVEEVAGPVTDIKTVPAAGMMLKSSARMMAAQGNNVTVPTNVTTTVPMTEATTAVPPVSPGLRVSVTDPLHMLLGNSQNIWAYSENTVERLLYWSVDDTDVVAISSSTSYSGNSITLTPKKTGTTAVTVRTQDYAYTKTFGVEVFEGKPDKLSLYYSGVSDRQNGYARASLNIVYDGTDSFGKPVSLRDTVYPANVLWSVDDPALFKPISGSGYYLNLYPNDKGGSSILRAEANYKGTRYTAEIPVTVTETVFTSLSLYNMPSGLSKGMTASVYVDPRDQYGSTLQDVTVVWTSDNPDVLTVTPDAGSRCYATLRAIGVGTATVTAEVTWGNVTKTISSGIVEVTAAEEPVRMSLTTPYTLLLGDVSSAYVSLYDRFGNSLTDEFLEDRVSWEIGNKDVLKLLDFPADSHQIQLTAVGPGSTSVTARYGNMNQTQKVEVVEPVPTRLTIWGSAPSPMSLNGGSYSIYAHVYDQFGNYMFNAGVSWSVSKELDLRGYNGNCYITPKSAGNATVTATCGTLTETLTIPIEIPKPASLDIFNPSGFILGGGPYRISASVRDQFGHSMYDAKVTWNVSKELGIDETDNRWISLTPKSAGNATITATCGNLTETIIIPVETQVPTSFRTSTIPTTMYLGSGPYSISAYVEDQFGNSISDAGVSWNVSEELTSQTIDAHHVRITPKDMGIASITVTCGNLTETRTIYVVEQIPTDLYLSSLPSEMIISQKQYSVSANVYDQSGTTIQNAQVNWIVSDELTYVKDPTRSNAILVTPVRPGIASVTANIDDLNKTAVIQVEEQVTEILNLDLGNMSGGFVTGQTYQVSASARNQFGDDMNAAVIWNISGNASYEKTDRNSIQITPRQAGPLTITAECSNFTRTATLQVEDQIPSSLYLTPSQSLGISTGQTFSVSASVRDQYGNLISDPDLAWEIPETVPYIMYTPGSAFFTPETEGLVTITVTCGTQTKSVTIPVGQQIPTRITLHNVPDTVSLDASFVIYAQVYDQFNQTISSPKISWNVSAEFTMMTDEDDSRYVSLSPVSSGTGTITAKCGNITEIVTLPVIKPVPASLYLSAPTSVALDTRPHLARLNVYDISGKQITMPYSVSWNVSEELTYQIADNTSIWITAVKPGTATITATCGQLTETFTVIVGDNVTPVTGPRPVSVGNNAFVYEVIKIADTGFGDTLYKMSGDVTPVVMNTIQGTSQTFNLLEPAVGTYTGVYHNTTDVMTGSTINIWYPEMYLKAYLAGSTDSIDGKTIAQYTAIRFVIEAPKVGPETNPTGFNPAVRVLFTTPAGGKTTDFGLTSVSGGWATANFDNLYFNGSVQITSPVAKPGNTSPSGTYVAQAEFKDADSVSGVFPGISDKYKMSNTVSFTVQGDSLTPVPASLNMSVPTWVSLDTRPYLATLNVYDTFGNPITVPSPVTWNVSEELTYEVADNTSIWFTAVKPGTAVITATCGQLTETFTVIVGDDDTPVASPRPVSVGNDAFVYETITVVGASTTPTKLVKYSGDATPVRLNEIRANAQGQFELLEESVGSFTGVYHIDGAANQTINIWFPEMSLKAYLGANSYDNIDGKTITKNSDVRFVVESPKVGAVTSTAAGGLNPAVRILFTTPVGGKTTDFGLTPTPGGWATANFDNLYFNGSVQIISPVARPGDNAPSGTYVAQAEFRGADNANEAFPGIPDKYKKSNTVSFTIQSDSLILTANKDSVVRSYPFTVRIQGESQTVYFVYLDGASASDVNPTLQSGQNGMRSYTQSAVRAGTKLVDDTQANLQNTFGYFKTDASGNRTVQYNTATNTEDKTYTIKTYLMSEDKDGGNVTVQIDGSVKVKIEKGAVTVTASGDRSYYIGEEIKLTGTNTDSTNVFLFITGPNLLSDGQMLTRLPTYVAAVTDRGGDVSVKTDNTWEYKWDTANCGLDIGTYTIYATSVLTNGKSSQASQNGVKLSDSEYGTVSFNLMQPSLSATPSGTTVARGDKLYIRGIAEGEPNNLMMYVFGPNYFLKDSIFVEDDGSYDKELKIGYGMSSNQYFVVIEHPMYNDRIDVNDNYGNPRILSIATAAGGNQASFIVEGTNKLQGSNAADALTKMIDSANIDDIYTKLTFTVQEAWIKINNPGDQAAGTTFTISGTTNLAVDDQILIEVVSSSFNAIDKTSTSTTSGFSQTTKVVAGDGIDNAWSIDVDTTNFKLDEYIIRAEGLEVYAFARTNFNLVEKVTPTVTPTPDDPGSDPGIPPIPAQYYGTVTLDGSPAPAGTIITAQISGKPVGSFTLTEAGVIGASGTFGEKLMISPTSYIYEGKEISFITDGLLARETVTFTSGASGTLALNFRSDNSLLVSLNILEFLPAGTQNTASVQITGASSLNGCRLTLTDETGTLHWETTITDTGSTWSYDRIPVTLPKGKHTLTLTAQQNGTTATGTARVTAESVQLRITAENVHNWFIQNGLDAYTPVAWQGDTLLLGTYYTSNRNTTVNYTINFHNRAEDLFGPGAEETVSGSVHASASDDNLIAWTSPALQTSGLLYPYTLTLTAGDAKITFPGFIHVKKAGNASLLRHLNAGDTAFVGEHITLPGLTSSDRLILYNDAGKPVNQIQPSHYTGGIRGFFLTEETIGTRTGTYRLNSPDSSASVDICYPDLTLHAYSAASDDTLEGKTIAKGTEIRFSVEAPKFGSSGLNPTLDIILTTPKAGKVTKLGDTHLTGLTFGENTETSVTATILPNTARGTWKAQAKIANADTILPGLSARYARSNTISFTVDNKEAATIRMANSVTADYPVPVSLSLTSNAPLEDFRLTLRSDKGTEYLNQTLRDYTKNNWISDKDFRITLSPGTHNVTFTASRGDVIVSSTVQVTAETNLLLAITDENKADWETLHGPDAYNVTVFTGANATLGTYFTSNLEADVPYTIDFEGHEEEIFGAGTSVPLSGTTQAFNSEDNILVWTSSDPVSGVGEYPYTLTLGEGDDAPSVSGRLIIRDTMVDVKVLLSGTVPEDTQSKNIGSLAVYTRSDSDPATRELEIAVSAGAVGRSLQGLDYLLKYPHDCPEQVASQMLAAVLMKQYYQKEGLLTNSLNTTIRSTAEHVINTYLAEGGVNAMQADGGRAWGTTAPPSLFYTAYPMYAIAVLKQDMQNDPEFWTNRQDIRLDTIDLNDSVRWLNNNPGWKNDPWQTMVTVQALDAALPHLSDNSRQIAESLIRDAADSLLAATARYDKQKAYVLTGLLTANNSLQDPGLQSTILTHTEALNASLTGDIPNSATETITLATYALGRADNAAGTSEYTTAVKNGIDYLTAKYGTGGRWVNTYTSAMAVRALNEAAEENTLLTGTWDITITIEGGIEQKLTLSRTMPETSVTLTGDALNDLYGDTPADRSLPVTITKPDGVRVSVAVTSKEQVPERTAFGTGTFDTPIPDEHIDPIADDLTLTIPDQGPFGVGEQPVEFIAESENDTGIMILKIFTGENRNLRFNTTTYGTAGNNAAYSEPGSYIRHQYNETSGELWVYLGSDSGDLITLTANEEKSFFVPLEFPGIGNAAIEARLAPMDDDEWMALANSSILITGTGNLTLNCYNTTAAGAIENITADITITNANGDTLGSPVLSELPEGTYDITVTYGTETASLEDLIISAGSMTTYSIYFLPEPLVLLGDTRLISAISTVPEPPEIRENTVGDETWSAAVPARIVFTAPLASLGEITAPEIVNKAGNTLRLTTVNATASFADGTTGKIGITVNETNGTLQLTSDPGNAETLEITFLGRKLGDVSGKGAPATRDASMIIEMRAGNLELSATELFYADVSGKGAPATRDASMIIEMRAGNLNEYYQ